MNIVTIEVITMVNFKLNKFLRVLLITNIIIFSQVSVAQNFRILVTNDDGISSPLLVSLAQALNKLPNVEVVVSAPSENQSGSSHSSIGRPLTVKISKIEEINEAYSVNGRPADAVRFALSHLGNDKSFDLVVSGINRGANVGDISHLSGTVGAAMEAVFQGVPAIAVSQEIRGVDTSNSAQFITQLVKHFMADPIQEGTIISVNIPAGKHKGVAIRPMGDSYLRTTNYELVRESENEQVYEREIALQNSENSETDTFAYQQGFITLTPLKFDWTAYESFEQIKGWDLRLLR